MMLRTILGGLLGGFAMFIIGFLFWGTPLSALALSRADPQASANLQAAMAQALARSGTMTVDASLATLDFALEFQRISEKTPRHNH